MKRFSADAGFLVLLGAMLLLLDPGVSLSVLFSAVAHEGGHLLAIRLCGGRLRSLHLGLLGAEIAYDGKRLGYGQEALCALAGPALNILLASALSLLGWSLEIDWLFLLAGAGLIQGAFNLLPARSLDGGRAIYMLVCARRGPEGAEKAACLLTCLTAFAILCLGAALLWRTGRNFTLLLLGLWTLLGELGRLTKKG